jgi:(3S)-malyl-CoA thioesterase
MPAQTDRPRPYRSVLYIPGSNLRALEKARDLDCDAIIFDLEDAVAAEEKANARALLARVLAGADYGGRARIVRVNGLDTPWGREDVLAFAAAIAAGGKVDAVLVPKVSSPADLDRVAALIPGVALWAMMETAAGMLNAAAIAAHPRLRGMVMGTNDLARELGSRFRADRLSMLAGLGLCLLAAKAEGRIIVDGV